VESADSTISNGRKRQRKPSFNPWSNSDFTRALIEEYYKNSHPKMRDEFKAKVATADGMSAAAVRQFFNLRKLEAQFRRTAAETFKTKISSAEEFRHCARTMILS
jgi:DICT domain-containing protein